VGSVAAPCVMGRPWLGMRDFSLVCGQQRARGVGQGRRLIA